MLKNTKIALVTASLATVVGGLAIGLPVALTTSSNNNSSTDLSKVSASAPAASAAAPSSAATTASDSDVQMAYDDAAKVDAAATALKAIATTSLSKAAFGKLTIDQPEVLSLSKLGLASVPSLTGVEVQVSKLPLVDKQFVRYTVKSGSKATTFRVEFNRFAGDNAALFAALASVDETGFTEDAFGSLTINSQPFDQFALKIDVPSALNAAAVVVSKQTNSTNVVFSSTVDSQSLTVNFTQFASFGAIGRINDAQTALDALTTSNLSLYMLGQAYANNQTFDGSVLGTSTPAAVQAVNVKFSKAYGKTEFNYQISEDGYAIVTGTVKINNYSADNSLEQSLVNYLINDFKSVSGSTLSEAAFQALALPEGTPWNAATLGVSFDNSLEMQKLTMVGNPTATYAQPLLAVSSWQDFPFLPHVSISKSAGSKTVNVRFTLGTSDLEQYNFVTQLPLVFNTFGADAAKQNLDALATALSQRTVSTLDASSFLATSVSAELPLAAFRLGFVIPSTPAFANLLAPLAANGISVKATKAAGSNTVTYDLSYAGQTKSVTVVFDGTAPTKDEVAIGKAVSAIKSVQTSSLTESAFLAATINADSFASSSLGTSALTSLGGLSVKTSKASGSAVVAYKVSSGTSSVTFDVTFANFAPATAADTADLNEKIMESKVALSKISATTIPEAQFKALFVAPGTPIEDSKLGIFFPKQVLDLNPTVSKAVGEDAVVSLPNGAKTSDVEVPVTTYAFDPSPMVSAAQQTLLKTTSTTYTRDAFLNLSFNLDQDYDAVSLANALGIGNVLNLNNAAVRIKKDAGSPTVNYEFHSAGSVTKFPVTFTSFNPSNISAADQAVLTALGKIRGSSYSFPAFGLLEFPEGTPFNAYDIGFELPAVAKGHTVTMTKVRDGVDKLASFTVKLTVEDIPGKPSVNINIWDFSSSKAITPTLLGAKYMDTVAVLLASRETVLVEDSFKARSFSNIPFDADELGILGSYAVAPGSSITMSKPAGSVTVTYNITSLDNAGGGPLAIPFNNFAEPGHETGFVQDALLAIYKTSLDAKTFYNTIVTPRTSILDAFKLLGITPPKQIDYSRYDFKVSKLYTSKNFWLEFDVTPKDTSSKPFRAIAWIALDNQTA